MGAYFSLLAYKNEDIKNSLFLSPVVNMKVIIDNMMLWSNTSEKELEEKQEIKTDFGQTLYMNYPKDIIMNFINQVMRKIGLIFIFQVENSLL